MPELYIDGVRIAEDEPAYYVMELGHNHGHDMEKAKRMVFDALRSGASAVKFQTRHPWDVYAQTEERGAYWYRSDNPQWMDPVYGHHRQALEFSREEWEEIFAHCRSMGITTFSTPFDPKSIALLEEMNVPAYKVASGDATNLPLIQEVAQTRKPTIISTGGCTLEEVDRLVETFTSVHDGLAILQCSCIYPAPPDVLNLSVIRSYLERYPQLVTGLSTHCTSIYPTIAAYVLGGRIFEHHFTSDRSWKGTDNHFSLLPDDMARLRQACEEIREAMGSGEKLQDPREYEPTVERRKKLVWAKRKRYGETVEEGDILPKCPGTGVEPRFLDSFVGQTVLQDIEAETDVAWSHVQPATETANV